MAAVRCSEDLKDRIAQAAKLEGRSAANYVEWVMRPIVDAALMNGHEGAGRSPAQATSGGKSPGRKIDAPPSRARKPAKPRTRGRASHEYVGCPEHPSAGAVAAGAGRFVCGEPGCPNLARMASA